MISGKEIKLGKIFNIEITLDYSWIWIFLILIYSISTAILPQLAPGYPIILYWLFGTLGALMLFGSVLIHELAHSLVANANKLSVKKITFFLFGGASKISEDPPTPGVEIKMAIAGPISSFVIGGLLLTLSYLAILNFGFSLVVALILQLGYINIILGLFNLIPGYPLDGGRVLRGVIWWRTRNIISATSTATKIGQIVAFGLMGYGVYELIFFSLFSGIWLILIGFFLLSATRQSLKFTILTQRLKNIPVSEIVNKNVKKIDAEMNIAQFANNTFQSKNDQYLVTKGKNNIGVISSDILDQISENDWNKKIENFMQPLDKISQISADKPASLALSLFNDTDFNVIQVCDHSKFIGLVYLTDIIHFLRFSHLKPR